MMSMMMRAALLSIAVLSLALIPPPAIATSTATLSATITDAASGMPLADATLHIAELGLTTQTDQAGEIRLSTPIAAPDFPVTITVAAPGYAPWTVRNVSLRAADTLRLAPALGSAPTTIDIPGPAALRRPAQPASCACCCWR